MQSFVPRFLLAAVSLAALVASNVPPAAAAGPASHFVANGDSAVVDSFGADGSFTELEVFRGGTPQNPQTFLFYEVCSPSACDGGFGLIPNRDFQSSQPGHMSLTTDTSAGANPDFFRFSGSGGSISVTWDKNSFFSESLQETFTLRFDNNTVQIHENVKADILSATAAGTVLGVSLSPDFAEMSSQHSSTIDICKGC